MSGSSGTSSVTTAGREPSVGALAEQMVDRSLADRKEAGVAEVRQLIDATYRVIATSGRFDPPIREILAEAGLSNPVFYRSLFESRGNPEGVAGATTMTLLPGGVEGRSVVCWVRE